MTIRMIHFLEAVQLPGRVSVITTWNATEHGRIMKAEETQTGIRLTLEATGDVVDVYRSNIKQITRAADTKPAPGSKK